jgi:membrane-anchored protein YejM (alkaline phosphatase superfamily)
MDQIKRTTDSATNRRPHFVYGHFMTPHEPHLSIDPSGTLMPQQTSSEYPLVNTYTAQIGYANNLMKELVTYIKQHNKHNTIIIIEGDHGFRQFLEGPEWFQRTSDSMKKYFLPNFNAVYFPDKNYSHLYDTMSPVNTFRIVFNQYFNQNFPLLKDSGTVVKDE